VTAVQATPKHVVDAERAVLGSLLIDPECFDTVRDVVRVGDFADPRHVALFQAAATIRDRNETPDWVTISAEVEPATATYAIDLINAVPTSVHAVTYARIVADAALERRVAEAADKIKRTGATPEQASALIDEASQGRQSFDVVSLGGAIERYFTAMSEASGETTAGDAVPATGVLTGFAAVDRWIGGMRAGEVHVVAARPGGGKSAYAFQVGRNVAGTGLGVLIFSLEMSARAIGERLLSAEAQVNGQALRSYRIDQDEWRRVSAAYGVLSELPIWIDETSAPTASDIRSRARRLVAEKRVGLVIVDYLQLIATPLGVKRVDAVGDVSRSLKRLARDLRLPVLALAQLNRAVEARQDHRPMLSDLRESGSIEQDADVVMFLNREELHNPQTDRRGVVDVIVAKHRNGSTGTLPLRFFADQTRFADLEPYRTEAA